MRILLLVLFVFSASTCFSQHYDYTHSGWKFSSVNNNRNLVLDKRDSSIIKHLSIEHDSGITVLYNQLRFPPIDSGMIRLRVDIDHLASGDTSSVLIYVNAQDDRDQIVVLKDPAVKKLLGNTQSGTVELCVPFDRKINTLNARFYFKGKCRLVCNNFSAEISGGEFGNEWKQHYADKIKTRPALAEQLQLLGKVWGFLKYFSPKISIQDIDWDRILVDNLDNFFRSTGNSGFDTLLQVMIDTTTGINPGNGLATQLLDTATDLEKMNIDHSWIVKSDMLDREFKEKLLAFARTYQPFENKYVQTPDKTNAPSPRFIEDTYDTNSLPEMKYRLLALFRYWNIIEYYDPYKYLIKDKWSHLLADLIPDFINANTSKKYKKALLKLNASIEDAHASLPVFPPITIEIPSLVIGGNPFMLPMKMAVLGDRIYVTKIDSLFAGKSGIQVKDEVLAINNISSRALIDSLRDAISHSRKEMKDYYINQNNLLSFAPSLTDSIVISYKRTGSRKSFRDTGGFNKQYNYKALLFENTADSMPGKNKAYDRLSEHTLYVNVSKWSKSDDAATRNILRTTKNVIIDCRYYPNWDFISFSACFFSRPTEVIKFLHLTSYPGLLREVVNSVGADTGFHYTGNIIVLMSEVSLSRPEMLLMFLKGIKGKTNFVGRTSAGGDGDICIIPMIGNQLFTFKFSGLGVFFPDNTQTQGVGIKPDIYVERSLEEDTDGKDLILQKALSLCGK